MRLNLRVHEQSEKGPRGSTRRGRIDANTVYQEYKSEPCEYGYESQLAASGLADVVDDE